MVLPVMGADWALVAGSLLAAVLVGKALHSETRLLMVALVASVLLDSYGGVLLAIIVCLLASGFDVVRRTL